MTQQMIGTVSHGTMRPQDLIPTFLDVLEIIAPDEYAALFPASFPVSSAHISIEEPDDSERWNSEEASDLLNHLFDTLDSYAPEGCYFGAHPGDGSDYGFWPIESDDEMED